MEFYKRHLPHWQPGGAEFFVTFRLANSLPIEAMKRLKSYRKQLQDMNEPNREMKNQRRIFQKYESLLDKAETGPTWLKEDEVARVVQRTFHFYDKKKYDLYAYCIMPNHVHIVFKHLESNENDKSSKTHYPITEILHSIKSYSALKCNKILVREGAFWQSESYDRVIRDQDELERTICYTLNNPVKVGLANHWQEWPYNYCKPVFIDTFTTM